jgi:competence protein ComFC
MTKLGLLNSVWNKVLTTVLPAKCVGCGVSGTYLCDDCLASALWLEEPQCEMCAEPGVASPSSRCRLRPLAVDGTVAVFAMDGVIRKAVHHLKYRNLRALAPILGRPMADALTRRGVVVNALVPIPMHPRQLRRRGYNQAALLAKEVGARLDVPVEEAYLRRHRWSGPQVATADYDSRWANVAYAFLCEADVQGKSLMLVDDVMTTGSTMHSAARTLKEAGAAQVWALALAREV